MTIVAENYQYVIGIENHSRTQTYAIINAVNGAQVGCEGFPVTRPGMACAIAWIKRNSAGRILAAIEGTKSYGSSIRRALAVEGIQVVEVKPPKQKTRRGIGKSGPIDAFAAARGVLGQETDLLLHPRRVKGTRGHQRALGRPVPRRAPAHRHSQSLERTGAAGRLGN